MPTCLEHGCPALVPAGRCHAHQQARNRTSRKSTDAERGSAYRRGYDNTRWKPARDAFIAKYPFCGMRPNKRPPVMSRCYERGVRTIGTQVDHVVPHKNDQQLFWDSEHNWQTLCARCGAAKSRGGL